MDTIMEFIRDSIPEGFESFDYMIRCFVFILILSSVLDIIKGITYKLSKGGM